MYMATQLALFVVVMDTPTKFVNVAAVLLTVSEHGQPLKLHGWCLTQWNCP